jgi:hypothetical protein
MNREGINSVQVGGGFQAIETQCKELALRLDVWRVHKARGVGTVSL